MSGIAEQIPAAVLALLNGSGRPGEVAETSLERRVEVRLADMPNRSLYVLRDELVGGAGGTGGDQAPIVEVRKLVLGLGDAVKGGWVEIQPAFNWTRSALGRARANGEDGKPLWRKLELATAVMEYSKAGSEPTIKAVTAIAITYSVRANDAAVRA